LDQRARPVGDLAGVIKARGLDDGVPITRKVVACRTSGAGVPGGRPRDLEQAGDRDLVEERSIVRLGRAQGIATELEFSPKRRELRIDGVADSTLSRPVWRMKLGTADAPLE
jgi:hypothetical protein